MNHTKQGKTQSEKKDRNLTIQQMALREFDLHALTLPLLLYTSRLFFPPHAIMCGGVTRRGCDKT
jgi:hypothetical protein